MTDMLDFLGMREEADIVIIFLSLAGLLGGLAYGFYYVTLGKTGIARNILWFPFAAFACFCGALVMIAGFLQLITFRWGELAISLLLGGGVGGAMFLLLSLLILRTRRRIYLRNPLMQEIVRYCRQNRILGIQCFPDRVRFFNALENEEYCKSEHKAHHEQHAKYASSSEQADLRPYSWKAYDNPASLVAVLKFADRDYPNVPDVALFAESLAQGLGGCGVAAHGTSVHYSYSRHNSSNGQREWVNHTTYTYQDHFVYRRSALKELQQKKAKRDREFAAQQKAEKKNTNHWN